MYELGNGPEMNPLNRERVAYDSAKMPLYIREGQLRDYPNLAYVCHWHEDLEFLCVMEGHMSYFVNGARYLLREGEGIFVNARQLHYGYSGDKTNSRFFCILLNPLLLCATAWLEHRFIRPLIANGNFPAVALTRESRWKGELLDLLVRAKAAYDGREDGFELELQSYFYQIWRKLYQNMGDMGAAQTQENAKLSCLKRMMDYIGSHIQQKVSLADIAAAGGICASGCSQLFRAYLNQTPMEYLTGCRLELACTMLRETDLGITDIAYRAGFSGASYFSERFRQHYGCSPRAFRASLGKGG